MYGSYEKNNSAVVTDIKPSRKRLFELGRGCEETLIYYQDMFDYLSEKMSIPVKLVQRKTYQEDNEIFIYHRMSGINLMQ